MKIGIYVDAENISRNGGFAIRYDVLKRFAINRFGGNVIRMNTYIAFDAERAKEDVEYRQKQSDYRKALRQAGWKIIKKEVKRFRNDDGTIAIKANADLDLAVDALRQGEHLDYILLLTGDGDFCRVVDALQDVGCRVELLAFENVSRDLEERVDTFYQGCLVPGLIPIRDQKTDEWGEIGSRVRGVFVNWKGADGGYGFLRFFKHTDGDLSLTDMSHPDSPYGSAFAHIDEMDQAIPAHAPGNRQNVFEFRLDPPNRDNNIPRAKDVTLVAGPDAN